MRMSNLLLLSILQLLCYCIWMTFANRPGLTLRKDETRYVLPCFAFQWLYNTETMKINERVTAVYR